MRKFSKDLAALMDEEDGDLVGALEDLRSGSRGFRELVESNRSRLDSTMDQFDSASANLERLTRQLSEISVAFQNIADKVERGEGTLGALVQDETLYHDLEETVQHLDELILDIQEHPKKYLRLEIF
jgi:phospholipid/cholesterol/gamma-HCH transport system substrate-binding protein